LGKKISDKERPEAFNKFRDEAFTKAKVNYDKSNLIHYETYRKSLRRFGLVDDFQMFKYPDTAFSYDLRTEDGIASLMTKVAEDYLEIKNGFESDPQSIRDELWPLFRVDYNPKFESFANDQLTEIDMDISQIDKIIATEGKDEGASKAAAKGTSLEGTVGNPIDLAESIRYTVDLRYIQSFGYKMEGIKDTIGKQDLFNLVQRNLGKDAPFKISEEEQTARDLAELKERAAKSKESPINEPAPAAGTEKTSTSPVNEAGDKAAGPTGAAPINPVESKDATKPAEVSATTPSTSSSPAEVVAEKPPVATEQGNILNVQMEPTPVTVTPPEASATTINQTNVATPAASPEASTSTSSSEKILKTESEKSTVNETKVKKGGFSKFLKNITESKIGQSLNLPGLVETAKDFAKVTKSEVLGGLPDFQKVKTGPNLINQVKESSKESVQAFKESTKTQKALEVVNQAKEMVSNKEKEQILEKSPQTTTATTKTETIEKAAPAVTPAAVSNTTNVTQNQGGAQATTNTTAQTTQEGSTSSQNVQNAAQSTTYQPAQMTTDLPQTQVGGQPAAFNTSEMEERLRRIEHVLMDGLEVTIKQY
jgi:hypothetical protein